MNEITINAYGEQHLITLEEFRYVSADGAKGILAKCTSGEPWGKLTVNLPDAPILPENHYYIKTGSENSWVKQLIKLGYFKETGGTYSNGFAIIQIWEITEKGLQCLKRLEGQS